MVQIDIRLVDQLSDIIGSAVWSEYQTDGNGSIEVFFIKDKPMGAYIIYDSFADHLCVDVGMEYDQKFVAAPTAYVAAPV